jgi:recombination protein RecT
MAQENTAKQATGSGGNKAGQAPATQKPESNLQLIKRSVVDVVKNKIDQFISSGELYLPKGYSPDNAMKAAWLILQQTVDKDGKPALEVCTRDSIANALLDMVVQGLNPIKKQNYFIAYGKTLTCQRSYFGAMAVAKMVQPKIDDFAFAVVYEGDKFVYGIHNAKKIVKEHEQTLENVDKKKIIAAYCIALDKEGEPFKTEIMTIDEILQAWKQSKMNPVDDKGNVKESSTHGKFTADMAMKTVINKICKAIINSSSDNALLLETMKRNDELADRASAEVEIDELANQGPVLEIEAETGKEQGEVIGKEEEQPAEEKEAARKPGF